MCFQIARPTMAAFKAAVTLGLVSIHLRRDIQSSGDLLLTN